MPRRTARRASQASAMEVALGEEKEQREERKVGGGGARGREEGWRRLGFGQE